MRLLPSLLILAALRASLFAAPAPAASHAPYNVIMVILDDMNDWVGSFGGNAQTRTPHMDSFARQGAVVFQNAQCAGPVCGPSRSALLSGFMPHRTGVYGNAQSMLKAPLVQTHATLPEYFSKHGYHALSMGKIFHKHPRDQGQWAFDQWEDVTGNLGVNREHLFSRLQKIIDGRKITSPDGDDGSDDEGVDFAWGPTREPKENTTDYHTAQWAARQLARPPAKPFFLAVGLAKPHLPWFVPQEYYDRHPLSSIKIPEYHLDDLDDIIDPRGRKKFSPSADFNWVKNDPTLFKQAVRGYLAAASYADECVGVVLDALEKSPFRDNTVVIIFGDHGWHLGEKLRFRKATLWAEATRLPLMIRVPGMTGRQDCPRLVSLMDLYQTLIDVCGLPAKPGIDGRSLAPLLRNPQLAWPHPVVTVNGNGNACVRDERWYLIHYRDGTEEFYDMQQDPMQWTNLIRTGDPAIRREIARMRPELPASYAPDVAQNEGGREAKRAGPDPALKAARDLAQLK